MRNVKRLWGVIGCMAVCILVLASLLLARSMNQPEPTHTPEPKQNNEQESERVVARIGSREITIGELQTALTRHYGKELLNQMLDREAIRLEGIEAGVTIEDAEIERDLKRMQQGYDSEEQFEQAMEEQLGMTKEELQEDVHYKLLLEKIATKNISISDAQVDDYIKTHPDEFRNETEYNIQQIIVSTKEQANKVLNELGKGEDFAILARDRSLDDATSNSGGDLGWIEEDDPFVAAPVLEAAKQLAPGEVSKPVAVEQGYAIVRLKDRREKENPERPYIREVVRKELALQEAPSLTDLTKTLRTKWGSNILDPQFR